MQSNLGKINESKMVKVFLDFILDMQKVNIFLDFRGYVVLKIKVQGKSDKRCFYRLKLDRGS